MGGPDENYLGMTRPVNIPGELHAQGGNLAPGLGQNRRALSAINRNIIGAPSYPCAISKISGLTEKHAIPTKIPPIPVHRPITRKFAAQMANTRQKISLEKTKQPVTVMETSASEDCDFNDVVDLKLTGDLPVPMFIQHTEAMLDEIDRMDEEIEMEDADEEPIMDIDSRDKKNHLAVVEYIDDIHAFYKKAEISTFVTPNYMAKQYDINERMRGILIDWLIEVHYRFELMDETLYLTVNLIDRFLAVQPVVRKRLQLVGVTAMLLACKYEEVSVPVVDDFILISDKAYSRREVLEMEKMMVNALQFNLSVPTPYVFMQRFLKAAQSDKKLELLSFFMIDLCLVEYEMLRFPPSLLAAAAIFTAQCSLSGCKKWTKICERHTTYTEDQLLMCQVDGYFPPEVRNRKAHRCASKV